MVNNIEENVVNMDLGRCGQYGPGITFNVVDIKD